MDQLSIEMWTLVGFCFFCCCFFKPSMSSVMFVCPSGSSFCKVQTLTWDTERKLYNYFFCSCHVNRHHCTTSAGQRSAESMFTIVNILFSSVSSVMFVRLPVRPFVLRGTNFDFEHYAQTLYLIFFVAVTSKGTIDFPHFVPLSVILTLT